MREPSLAISHYEPMGQISCYRSSRRTVRQQLKISILSSQSFPVHFPSATCKLEDVVTREVGEDVVLHGYLGTQRQAGKNLLFAELRSTTLSHSIQLVASNKTSFEGLSVFDKLSGLNIETPVAIEGKIKTRKAKSPSAKVEQGAVQQVTDIEIELTKVSPLNHFPKDIMVTQDSVFSAEQRHLQLRMEKPLRDALAFRSKAASILRRELCEGKDFVEIETPLLFPHAWSCIRLAPKSSAVQANSDGKWYPALCAICKMLPR
jgi:aspartyl-tRNA synthetase